MGRLSSLLKTHKADSVKNDNVSVTKPHKIFEKVELTKQETISPETKEGIFDLSIEELEIIKNSVVKIDTTDKKRKDIIIGMYGLIKNPKTGERFNIPTLTWDDDDYIYQYANFMKTLVNRPDEFKKVMNWE